MGMNLQNAFVEELGGFYDAVGQLQSDLSQMARTARDENLSREFRQYLKNMSNLTDRLERVFSIIKELSGLGEHADRVSLMLQRPFVAQGVDLKWRNRGEKGVESGNMIPIGNKNGNSAPQPDSWCIIE